MDFNSIKTIEDFKVWADEWALDDNAYEEFRGVLKHLDESITDPNYLSGGEIYMDFGKNIVYLNMTSGEKSDAYLFTFNVGGDDMVFSFEYHAETGKYYRVRLLDNDIPSYVIKLN